MGAEPTLAEIVRLALESRLLDLHVALPCRVESYDATTQTIEALPMVRRAITDTSGETQHEDLPTLPNVPVLFPRSAAFSASWPLAPGDFVLVVFCSSAIGNWRESGDIADPGDLRRHDLSHAVAIPGIGPKGSTIPTSPTAAVLEVTAPATHVAVGAAATDFAALASKVEGIVGALAAEILNATAVPNDGGAAIQTAAKTALGLLGWTGGGTTPPANSTAATKLKSE
jgi:hypothetical protein